MFISRTVEAMMAYPIDPKVGTVKHHDATLIETLAVA
jgi:hypothetical protein